MPKPVMTIPWDYEGVLRTRPNRFLGLVDIITDSGVLPNQQVHIHDPGRLKEILFPGNRVRVLQASNPKRKTQWDLIAGYCDQQWVLINSKYHRRIAEWIPHCARSVMRSSYRHPDLHRRWRSQPGDPVTSIYSPILSQSLDCRLLTGVVRA